MNFDNLTILTKYGKITDEFVVRDEAVCIPIHKQITNNNYQLNEKGRVKRHNLDTFKFPLVKVKGLKGKFFQKSTLNSGLFYNTI